MAAFDPITAIANLGTTLINRLIPDKAANAAAKAALLEMQAKGELAQLSGQLEINKAEATNPNWFVAGWRPAIGWICGCGLASQFIVRPFTNMALGLLAVHYQFLVQHPVVYPSLDMGTLMTLLLGMLGLATNRTYEKLKKAQANH